MILPKPALNGVNGSIPKHARFGQLKLSLPQSEDRISLNGLRGQLAIRQDSLEYERFEILGDSADSVSLGFT